MSSAFCSLSGGRLQRIDLRASPMENGFNEIIICAPLPTPQHGLRSTHGGEDRPETRRLRRAPALVTEIPSRPGALMRSMIRKVKTSSVAR